MTPVLQPPASHRCCGSSDHSVPEHTTAALAVLIRPAPLPGMLGTPDKSPSFLWVRWEGREAAPGGAAAPLCGGRSRCRLGTRTPARSSQTRCLRPMHRFLWHQEKLLPHRFEALLCSLPSFPTALIPLCEQPSLPSFKAPALQDTAVILGCCFIALCLAGKHSQLCLILRVKKKKKEEKKSKIYQ